MKCQVTWDTDGAKVALPNVVEVPDDIVEEDQTETEGAIADWLSAEYGWCVDSIFILEDK